MKKHEKKSLHCFETGAQDLDFGVNMKCLIWDDDI